MERHHRHRRHTELDLSGRTPAHQLGQIEISGTNYRLLDMGAWSASNPDSTPRHYVPGNLVSSGGVQYVATFTNTNDAPPSGNWNIYKPDKKVLSAQRLWVPKGYDLVEDEGVALAQETTLNFVGAGVTATDDPVNLATIVTIPGTFAGGTYTDYTPTVTATGTNPTLGTSTLTARWARVGNLVHYYGELTLSGVTVGTGRWRLSVPAHVPNSIDTGGWTTRPNAGIGVANIFGQHASGNMVCLTESPGGGATYLVFLTQDALPFGNAVYFGDAAGFTFADLGFSDILLWSIVYETDIV